MPKVRNILIHVGVERAKGRRKCYRNQDHRISQGEWCLVVRTGPTKSKHNYCRHCAQEILDLAEKRLAEVRGDLALRYALGDDAVEQPLGAG